MNRYGRHGTRAWLRRYLRRREEQQAASTTLIAVKPFIPVVVFNITVPAGVGKVIIVVTDEQGNLIGAGEVNNQINTSDTETNQTSLQNTDENPRISRELQEIVRLAQSSAKGWVEYVQSFYANEYVSPNERMLKLLAQREGRKLAQEYSQSKGYEGIDELTNAYVQYFLAQFAETSKEDGSIGPILSRLDSDIRDIAARDKEQAPPRHMRPYHQRDLGVIQAMLYLNIRLDEAPNHLEEIHVWADKYDKIYANPGKGVSWPTPETFRQI